jgi:hypothetical protein
LKEDLEYGEGKYFKLWKHLAENAKKFHSKPESNFMIKLIQSSMQSEELESFILTLLS